MARREEGARRPGSWCVPRASATDDYIAAAILRGRAGTSMRHFGRPMTGFATLEKDEVAHIVAHPQPWRCAEGARGKARR
ncbi:MAG: hypothetical protein U0166_28680 [Acidobacteriota bacterium]